jgi:hypothetical protein
MFYNNNNNDMGKIRVLTPFKFAHVVDMNIAIQWNKTTKAIKSMSAILRSDLVEFDLALC